MICSLYSNCCKSFVTITWILLCFVNWTRLNPACHARSSREGRFLINLFADVAEIFQHIPKSSLKELSSKILTRTQNDYVSNREFGKSKSVILSNNFRHVRFLVYNNHRNPNSFLELDVDKPSVIPSFQYVTPSSSVKILIHGYNFEDSDNFPRETKDAYLATTNYPVIWVDWQALSTPKVPVAGAFYPSVAENVPRVALRLFHLIEFLLRNRIINHLRDIHLIGHSVGAHIAGQTGQLVFQQYGAKLGRITGLDPAGPLFKNLPPSSVLDSSDANFVDVIHSSLTGISYPLGHADFYPNGGQVHPHCLNMFRRFLQCNHNAAYAYFTTSILHRKIIACGCNSYQNFRTFCAKSCSDKATLGEFVSHRARGKFYLDYDLRRRK